MRTERHPDNSDPIKLLEELEEAPPESALRHVLEMIKESPIENLVLTEVATYPHLPEREWTEEELGEIARWLHEIIGIVEACKPVLREILSAPTVTEEDQYSYEGLLNLSAYLGLIEAQVSEQKEALRSPRKEKKSDLSDVTNDLRARIFLRLRSDEPGDA